MYCKNCGNLIGEGDKFCAVCGAKQNETIVQEPKIQPAVANSQTQPAVTNPQIQQPVVENKPCNEGQGAPVESSRKKGLGLAIPAAALGFVAQLFAGLEVFLAFVAIAMSVPALILGIKSINIFNAERKAGRKKPVATLVLGIVATVFAGIAIMLFLLWFA
ncbi:MAG: zinc ribbon domain-containing protein [Clostridia bacterium]|nr:zinc ribbon domain-containing protein [Clostridia bacterium]